MFLFVEATAVYCCGVVVEGVVLLPLLVEPVPLGVVLEPELVVLPEP